MSHEATIQSDVDRVLSRLRRRQRWINALWAGGYGVCAAAAGLTVFGLGVFATGAWWIETSAWQVLLALAGCGGIGALVGMLLPVDNLRLARALDRASQSADRFASAMQLASHHRRARVQLIVEDAMARVGSTAPSHALPLRPPRTLRWAPLIVLASLGVLWLAPARPGEAAIPAPEISAEEWAELQDDFQRELNDMPEALTPQELDLRRELEQIAESLEKNPVKEDVLRDIARLRERLDQRRQSMGAAQASMRAAAKAISQSQSLQSFAATLKEGDYEKAAEELQSVAEKLESDSRSLSAEEAESMASDLERMAQEMSSHEQLQQECQKCAGAAASMDRQALSQALRQFSKQMKQNAEQLRKSDQLCRASNALDQLKRMMNRRSQCQGCKQGCSSCQGGSRLVQGQRPGNKPGKGGLRAGRGTAPDWRGGSIDDQDERREGEMAEAHEGVGENTTFKLLSPDERAQSGQAYQELFADFVKKAEADLELELAPIACREYLRRYFESIRPQESAPASPADAPVPVP